MISVIVACRNEKRHICGFLDSLFSQQDPGCEWEAVIADGMSADGTRELLEDYRRQQPRLTLIDNPERIVSTGLNRAIQAARGSILVRMDAHTEYAPDYILRSVEELDQTGADNVGGPARTRASGLLGRTIAAAFHSPFVCGRARFHDTGYQGFVDTVPYGCWRRATLERLGLFDENLIRNQDDELNLRIMISGGRIWQSPDIVSWYRPRDTLRALALQQFRYGFWKVAVIAKHGRAASWRHLIPGAMVLSNVALLAGSAAGHARVLWFVPGPFLLELWLLCAGIYGCAALLAGFLAGRTHGWAVVPLMPVVAAVYHFSYGAGFLVGLLHAWMRSTRTARRDARRFAVRFLERVTAAVALLAISPLLLGISCVILLESGWPVLFRQQRVGILGRPFRLWKFRSMRADSAGVLVTVAGDRRITRVGAFLRRYKLDELPQLWNVLAGDMSFIGPRPEVFEYVRLNEPVWQSVLAVRPGITDLATLVYRNEEELLAKAAEPESFYRESLLPRKLALNVQYLRSRTLTSDLRLLISTVKYSLAPACFDADRLRNAFKA